MSCMIFRKISRIIPAFAGNTSIYASILESSKDHPRIRGEHILHLVFQHLRLGSSPHSRGTRLRYTERNSFLGIIPAFAGNTPHFSSAARSARDHPRIRGEHNSRREIPFSYTGSSPHSRGTQSACKLCRIRGRIIPAFAGNTLDYYICRVCLRDHPRIRGEHEGVTSIILASSGSSPHSRGTQVII